MSHEETLISLKEILTPLSYLQNELNCFENKMIAKR